jgi:hypothetical protein
MKKLYFLVTLQSVSLMQALRRYYSKVRNPARAKRTVSWEEYARAIHLILNGFGKGIDTDFKSRNLVGVGHSMGTAAMSALNIIPLCDPSTHVLSQNPNQDNVSVGLMVGRDSDRAYVYPSRLFWGSKQVPDGGRCQASRHLA